MSSIVTVGIDPGKKGGVVALGDGRESLLRRIAPTLNVGKRGKTKIEYDDSEMFEIVLLCRKDLGPKPVLFVLEQQQARPQRKVRVNRGGKEAVVSIGQGATSNFTTGVGFGLWRMALVAARVPFEIVHPRTWTKVMLAGVPGEGKERNIISAKRLLPGVNIVPDIEAGARSDRATKPHDGLADAALLALYGFRKIGVAA